MSIKYYYEELKDCPLFVSICIELQGSMMMKNRRKLDSVFNIGVFENVLKLNKQGLLRKRSLINMLGPHAFLPVRVVDDKKPEEPQDSVFNIGHFLNMQGPCIHVTQ